MIQRTAGFEFRDFPSAFIVPLTQRSPEARHFLIKQASAIDLSDIRPIKGHTLVHLNALGEHSRYGFNSNGDGFRVEDCQSHPTFVKHGKFYYRHHHHPGDPEYGSVKRSAYNTPMHRVELLIDIDNNKGTEALDDLEKRGEFPVSMSCVLDPEYPVLTVDGYKAISTIAPGDRVFTHTGAWKKVKSLTRRVYTGTTITFHISGLPRPLEVTADHPMLAKVFAAPVPKGGFVIPKERAFGSQEEFDAAEASWTHAKHINVGDRFLFNPSIRFPGIGAVDDVRLAKLLGFYLAEGSLGFNDDKACTIVVSCAIDDAMVREVPQLVYDIDPDITCKLQLHRNSNKAMEIKIYNTPLAEFMHKYVGRGCKNKFICPEIFNAAKDIKLAFIGAWLDGDGFVDKKGIHWSSANFNLVLQGRDLLASIGIASSVYKIDHSTQSSKDKWGVAQGMEYTLNIPHIEAPAFVPWSSIAAGNFVDVPRSAKRGAKSMKMCGDGLLALRIKAVDYREVTATQTYNLEVEDDESYSLGGLISHNCSVKFDVCNICGNEAKSRLYYCDHAKHHLTKIADDGSVVGVFNPNPRWFDISKVIRPADKIAWTFRKVASGEVVGSAEIAELEHVHEPAEFGTKAAAFEVLKKLSEIEKKIEGMARPADTGDLAKGLPCGDCDLSDIDSGDKPGVLGALADAKITLSLQDFLKLMLGHRFSDVEGSVGDMRRHLPGIFSELLGEDELPDDSEYFPGHSLVSEKLYGKINGMKAAHSLDRPAVTRRISVALIQHSGRDPIVIGPHVETKTAQEASQKDMAREYALYKLAFCRKVNDPFVSHLVVLHNHIV